MSKIWNKWFLVSLIALGAMGAVALVIQGCSKGEPVEAANAKEAVKISSNGDDVTFSPNAPQLKQFMVDTVGEASLVLTISAPAYNMVSVEKSELDGKKIPLFETQDLTDTYSNYVTAVASLQHSSLALARTRDLYSHDIAAARDLQDAEQDYATQQASVADADAKLRAAGIDPKELQAAPAGTVWAIADVPEEQVTSIKPGMRVELEYIAYPKGKFIGQLASIGQAIDPSTRKVKVRIVLANPAFQLHAAMFGTADFIGTSRRAVTVPTTAIVREGDGTMSAWVTDNGYHFMRRTVAIGLQEDGQYQITDGLTPGDRLVVRGGVFLSNMNQVGEPD